MRISAKNLGILALTDCCPRCFWMRAKLGWKSPWAIMPGIFSSIDGYSKRAILNLKTARYSDHQDSLLPMYQIQLVGYALIAESLGMGTVEALGLVYGEPPPNDANTGLDALVSDLGFSMPFKATAMPIEPDRALIPPLLRKAKEILEMKNPPEGQEGCKECKMVEEMARLCGKLCRP